MKGSPPGTGEIRRIYDGLAPRYDRWERLAEWLVTRRLRRRLVSLAQGRVLEVAIGTGLNLPHYPAGCHVVGIDLSAGMLAQATQRATSLDRAVPLVTADAEALPFPDAAFDTVLSTFTSCTFPNPVRALGEMARVCRPDGQILLLEHVRVNTLVIGRLQDLVTGWTVRRFGCHQNRDAVALARAAGLRLERVERALLGYLCLLVAQPGEVGHSLSVT